MNAEMRDLLAKASVISEVSASRMDPNKTGHQKPSDMPPAGTSRGLYDELAAKFRDARSPQAQQRAVEEARKMIAAAKRTPPPPAELLIPGSLAWKRHIAERVVKAESGGAVKEIARLNRISRATAYNYAKLYGERDAA